MKIKPGLPLASNGKVVKLSQVMQFLWRVLYMLGSVPA
jgi:hypothetical protein